MSVTLEAFPKLSRKLLTKIGYISSDYSFYYHRHGETFGLNSETTNSATSRTEVLKLTDPLAQWHPEDYELCADVHSRINVPAFLFGEHGLASFSGGVIGIAVMWMLPESNSRGVIPVSRISRDTAAPFEVNKTLTFSSGVLRGTLVLRNVLYVINRGNPSGAELFQANRPGTILGTLDETRVIIDGNGSMFPVHEVASPSEPLWWVSCNWSDATEDKFTDENFCLYLNTAHKDYAALDANKGIKQSPLLMEILCSAIEILINKVMQDPVASDAIISNDGMSQGSVASIVNFFFHKFDWKYDKDNPQSLAIEIRKSLMKVI